MSRLSLQRLVIALSAALLVSAPALANPHRQSRNARNAPHDFAPARNPDLDPKVAAALHQLITNNKMPPGFAVVVHDGHVVLAEGWGNHTGPQSGPANGQSLFRVGSVTKTFTALGIVSLAEHGKLSLDDPLEKWIPEVHFKLKLRRDRQPTIRDALYHFSGLPGSGAAIVAAYNANHFTATNAEIIDSLKAAVVSPGRENVYSNLGFNALGLVIEKASHESYYSYMKQHVFGPLGITDERWNPPQVPRNQLVFTHSGSPGHWTGVADAYVYGATNPAGGLYVSGDDMLKLMKWELGEQQNGPVSPRMRLLTQTPADHSVKPPGSGRATQPMGNSGMGWDAAPDSHGQTTLLKNGGLPNTNGQWTAVIGVEPSTHTAAVVLVSGAQSVDLYGEANALIAAAQSHRP